MALNLRIFGGMSWVFIVIVHALFEKNVDMGILRKVPLHIVRGTAEKFLYTKNNKISLNISQVYFQRIKCSVKIAGMKMKPVQNIVLVVVKRSNQNNHQ